MQDAVYFVMPSPRFWTSIADKERFWTENADMFSAQMPTVRDFELVPNW
jgi:hypothetical protein